MSRHLSLSNRGFTLIELLVVIAILGILSTIGLVSFQAAAMRGRNGKRVADINQVRSALELHRSANPSYPASGYATMINALVTGQYISQPTPTDPKPSPYVQYSYTSTGATYCLCASLEGTNLGNSTGSCTYAAGNFYCVNNP